MVDFLIHIYKVYENILYLNKIRILFYNIVNEGYFVMIMIIISSFTKITYLCIITKEYLFLSNYNKIPI